MNYTKAFTYMFEDKDWVSKLLIAGLIGLIPVIGPIYLSGWTVEIVRRIKAGRTDVLPRTHFSAFLSVGVKYLLIGAIYAIPATVLSSLSSSAYNFVDEESSAFVMILGTSFSCFGTVLSIVLGFLCSMLSLGAVIRLAQSDSLADAMRIREVFADCKANAKLYAVITLLQIVSGIIAIAGILVCGIGLIFTAPYSAAVTGALTALAWMERVEPVERLSLKSIRNSRADRNSDDIIEKPERKSVPEKEEEKDLNDVAPAAPDENWVDPVLSEEAIDDAVTDEVEKAEDTVEDIVEESVENIEEVIEDAEESGDEEPDESEENDDEVLPEE